MERKKQHSISGTDKNNTYKLIALNLNILVIILNLNGLYLLCTCLTCILHVYFM